MNNRILGLLAVGLLAGTISVDGTANTLPDPLPVTSNVAVNGTTVTATVTPYSGGTASIDAAEFFVDMQGTDGSGTPMTLSGSSGPVTATGTLPTLAIGSTHLIYVHGHDDYDPSSNRWGSVESTSFTVDSTTVATPIGGANISYFNFGAKYVISLWPTDPCSPVDPCRVRSRFGTWNAADTLGYSRTTFSVPDGQVSLFTKVTLPQEPCAPTDPCRKRDVLIGFVATNGLKYSADTVGLDTTYLAK